MARDVPAGRAFIELFLKGDNLDRDMRRMRRRLTRITGIISGVAAAFTAVGVAAGTVAVAGIIKATNAAGDFAETVSKFETVFGGRAAAVREWAEETAEALGITRREALSTLSSFQDLFVPLGIDAATAEDMSKQLTQLSVDLASFNNMASADVVRDLQAAMTGSSETMKKYGAIVDAAAVKQELLNKGIDPKAATNAEKAMARLSLIMASTTAAQGDAVRTAESYNNLLKRLNTQLQEITTQIGEKFLPVMTDLAKVALNGMQQLREAVENNMPDFGGLDKRVLELAKSGSWELAGEMIGLQIKMGVRKAMGEELFDLLAMANRAQMFGALSFATNESGGIVGQALARPAQMSLGAFGMATTEGTTESLNDQMDELIGKIDKVIAANQQTTQAIEDQEGFRLQ